MIDAVILDLGNVLAFHDNEKLFTEMASAFRVTRDELRARLEGGLWDRVNRGQLPGDALRQELVARLGQELSPDAWFALWNCHFTIHEEMVRTVEQLVGRVRLVLLSNTHDQHVAWLRPRLPVLERFDGLVLSYEVGAIKPERLIYERALAAAAVPPGRAVFFDDVARYAEAAAQVGLHGRVFTTAGRFREDLRTLGRADLVD
ncbi:MAG: HAD family phosphatase [Myxococcota bacterium]|jgi:putative hydrolase of the HAD superfamily